MVRIPWLQYWDIKGNQLFNLSNVLIWSNVECGIGIVAGSLPMLGRLVRRWLQSDESLKRSRAETPSDPTLVTVGGSGGTSSSKLRKIKGLSTGSLSRTGLGVGGISMTVVENSGSYHALEELESPENPNGGNEENYGITVQRDVQVQFEMVTFADGQKVPNDTEGSLCSSTHWPSTRRPTG